MSFGQGNPANVPWIAFLGHNQKVKNGIYPVLLFYRKLKGIPNLIVAYGISKENKPSKKWDENIIQGKQTIRDFLLKQEASEKDIEYPNSYVAKAFRIKKETDVDNHLKEIINALEEVINDFHRQFDQQEGNQEGNMHTLFSNLMIDPSLEKAFYNSLKTKSFIILAGQSGTGKTKIVENFAKLFSMCTLETEDGEILNIEGNCNQLASLVENINSYLLEKQNRGKDPKIYVKIDKYKVPIRALGFKDRKNTSSYHQDAKKYNLKVLESDNNEFNNLQELDKKLILRKTKNFLFFPIRPDFRESKSLLGYYNPFEKKYHSTPLLDFILKAAEKYLKKGKNSYPFFVLLDEMNLARVEYYFADFLSILEAQKFTSKEEAFSNPSFRDFLQTFNINIKDLNKDSYLFSSHGIKLHQEENARKQNIPYELFLPPNLYFIGTVNIDETTHAIAPKVLDRAFVLEFEVCNFEEYISFLGKPCGNPVTIPLNDFTKDGKFTSLDKKTIKEYISKNNNVLKLLNDINKSLKIYGFHFGYRVFDEIIMFLANNENSIPELKLPKEKALDYAIKSKVLPKLNGVRYRLEKPILNLLELLTNNENSEKFEKINSFPWFEGSSLKINLEGEKSPLEVKSEYPQTVKKLLEMLFKLKTEGFTSFI